MNLYNVHKWLKGLLFSGLALVSSTTVFQAGGCGLNVNDLSSLLDDVISELDDSGFGSDSGGRWDEPAYSGGFEDEPLWDDCGCDW